LEVTFPQLYRLVVNNFDLNKIIKFVFATVFIVGCNFQSENADQSKIISVDNEEIVVVFNGQSFPWKIEKDNLSFPYKGDANKVGFITATDTINFELFPSDTVKVDFILNEKDTIKAALIGQSKPAEFDATYRENNVGKYKVFSPKVHELVNIGVALTNIGKQDSNMVYMNSDYYSKVISHFDKYKNHALIDSLNQHITEVFGNSTYNYYYNIRMNACMYSFDDDSIVNHSPYDRLGFGGNNRLQELIPLLEEFSMESDFNTFYTIHADYHQSLIDTYYELVPIPKMWEWIEKKFPQRYGSYKIYFSPLIGGAHSTQNFSDNEFQETVMFINAPIFSKEYTSKEKEAILSRVVFTEIDHNYVNPTTDKFSEIGTLLEPLNCWNNGTQGYHDSYSTFNEYMTWAIFTFYLYDNFDKELFEKRNKIESDFMVNGRGFLKFKEFNDLVLQWYMNNPDTSFDKLYPKVIEWIKAENCE